MDAHLLETTLALVDTPDDALTRRFRAILFERHPSLRPGFGEDAVRLTKRLRSAIVSAADHLDDPVWLTETLGQPGSSDGGWTVLAERYDAVTECMVAAMAERGAGAWTAQMTDAWTGALDAVSGLVLNGRSEGRLAS